jgi:hypothetical protein
MKPHRSTCVLLLLIFVFSFGFVSASDARHNQWVGSGAARLVIKRAPDLGNLAYVDVKIDGSTAAGILYAQSYDGSLPTGHHTIQIRLAPAYYSYSPSALNLNVRPGETYAFMAMKRGGALVLARCSERVCGTTGR